VVSGILFLTIRDVARSPNGSEDLRGAFRVMTDEMFIAGGTWVVVDRGNMDFAVYSGLGLYVVAIVKLCEARDSVQKVLDRTRWVSLIMMPVAVLAPFVLLAFLAENRWVAAIFAYVLVIHPETVLFVARIHPDAVLLFFDHAALACLELVLANDRRCLLAAPVSPA
jgi:hypothetical protein